ncbi:hypothetical protein [Corynebacterium flavescens]|uniref:hypothetical protein n=1 Tax=Corynebacterium flavescens TaxID=28028 RepID=UPI002647B32B|nr:hypothetical protein [Corynebacterium flavescens]MDN6099118.1 hypothetical protein [Corynebacterium flavescens]MDN6200246.1 hypothetical protein [Corynebacterium flavescens]MDN6226464.1 hypothetical protein [Corynebacterium flavescens]MDN6236404.1 hypothetical protein [Corynebacterium flavescens]MDN6431659.1 hypothetical protein [Corynebacterium flavescens]
MNSLKGLLNSVSAVFKSATGTGLDTLASTPVEARVTEKLVEDDLIPATRNEVIEAFKATEGRSPSSTELPAVELFLLDFGWLD